MKRQRASARAPTPRQPPTKLAPLSDSSTEKPAFEARLAGALSNLPSESINMTSEEQVLKQVRAALEFETRINLHRFPLHLDLQGGTLTLKGDVQNIAAKRLAVRLAGAVPGIDRVADEISVIAGESKEDGEILEAFSQFLLRQTDLKNATLRRRNKGQVEVLHEAPGEATSGLIEFGVNDGIISLEGSMISLSHRRMVEVLAWWVPGRRSVINRLTVAPPEQDTDDEVSDAVHLALEMDPLLADADQILVTTSLGTVTLGGIVGRAEERETAELDAWYVPGVDDVVNQLTVAE